MSYRIDISFKNCKKEQTYDKITEFEDILLKNAEEYIKNNLCFCQYDTDKDRWYNNDIIDKFISRLFKHHIWYCEDIQALCIVYGSGVKEIQEWFDGYIYFQNSTDQNYDYEEWLFNDKFKSIVEWVQNLDEEQFRKEFIKENKYYEESQIKFEDYYKKSLVYDKCYHLISPIWSKGFAISFLDGALDENKFKLRNMTIRLLMDKYEDFKKIYIGEQQ